jgi:hypothetical protein
VRAGGEDAIRFCSRALGPCDWPAGLGWVMWTVFGQGQAVANNDNESERNGNPAAMLKAKEANMS